MCMHYCLHLKRDLADLVYMMNEKEDAPKTIVFCRTRNDCAKVYSFLCKSAPRNTVSMYHSSLTQATKRQVQADFKSGTELRCLSATIAFGMVIGIKTCAVIVTMIIIYRAWTYLILNLWLCMAFLTPCLSYIRYNRQWCCEVLLAMLL